MLGKKHIYRQHIIAITAMLGTVLLSSCGDHPSPGQGMEDPMMQPPSPEVVTAQEAINSPDIPAIDPQTMGTAEVEKVLGDVPYCAYRYTIESPHILAISNREQDQGYRGVIKIHGRLVELSAEKKPNYENLQEGLELSAEGLKMKVVSDDEGSVSAEPGEIVAAKLLFSLEQGLTAGYLGWYRCEPE